MTFIEDREPKNAFDGKIDPLPPFDPDKPREASFDRDQVGDQVGVQAGSKWDPSADPDPLEDVDFEQPLPDPETKPKQKSTRLKKTKKEMKLADIPFRMGRVGQTPEQKPTPKKDSGKKKKVDVRLDNGDWFTFDSVTAAADSIGGSCKGLSTALKNGTKFHGHEVRWNNPELDATLAEIDKSNKTPYQPSSPVK